MAQKKSTHILIIEDEVISRTITRRILEASGYLVEESATADEGINLALKQAPHLIILDLVLPGKSGFDFLEMKRKLEDLKEVPVLVLSGLQDRESVYKAISLGAIEYSTKPIEARALIQKIRKALRDKSFPKATFSQGHGPKVDAQAPGKILTANEVGFLMETPFKIAPGTQVKIESPLLDELACTSCVFRKTDKPSKGGFSGQYLNEIAVIGLSMTTVERIRKIVRGW